MREETDLGQSSAHVLNGTASGPQKTMRDLRATPDVLKLLEKLIEVQGEYKSGAEIARLAYPNRSRNSHTYDQLSQLYKRGIVTKKENPNPHKCVAHLRTGSVYRLTTEGKRFALNLFAEVAQGNVCVVKKPAIRMRVTSDNIQNVIRVAEIAYNLAHVWKAIERATTPSKGPKSLPNPILAEELKAELIAAVNSITPQVTGRRRK